MSRRIRGAARGTRLSSGAAAGGPTQSLMPASIVTCPNCGRKNRLRPSSEGVPRCSVCHATLPWVVDADRETFDAELAASVPVVIDFWAPWCGPCRMVTPALESVARAHAGRLKVVKLNVDDEPEIGARYQVQGIPLLVLVRDGQEVDRLVGAAPERDIEAWLRRHVDVGAGTAA
jgi:thioredoxin 2